MIPTHARCAFPSCPNHGEWLLVIDALPTDHEVRCCRDHAQRMLEVVDMIRACDVNFHRYRS